MNTCNVRYPEKINMPSFILPDSQGHKSLSLNVVSSGQLMEESQPLIVIKGKILEHQGSHKLYPASCICGHGKSSLSQVRLPFLQGKGGGVLRELSPFVLRQQLQFCPSRRSYQVFIGFTVRTQGSEWSSHPHLQQWGRHGRTGKGSHGVALSPPLLFSQEGENLGHRPADSASREGGF